VRTKKTVGIVQRDARAGGIEVVVVSEVGWSD
jgi:hypothetical protein